MPKSTRRGACPRCGVSEEDRREAIAHREMLMHEQSRRKYEPPSMEKYKTVEDLIFSLVTHVHDPRALLMAVHKRARLSCFYCADCDIDFGVDYRGLFAHVETPEHLRKESEAIARIKLAGGCVTCGAFNKRDCRCGMEDGDEG